MRHLALLLALFFALATAAQNRRPAAKRPATTTRKPATSTHTNPAAKNPAAANNPTIKKAVSSNPQYKEVSFSIHGKAHGFADGEWVKLCEPGKNGPIATDSVQLSGEDFAFSGKTLNVPHLQYIVTGTGVTKTLVELFVEEGTISVDITASQRIDRVSGTAHNNIYTPYRDSVNAIYTQIYNCTRESMRLSNPEADREAYRLGADSLRQQIVDYTYTFARKNLNNWVGIYLFAQYYRRFTPAQNKSLLAAVPKKFASLPIIADIRKFARTQK